MADKSTIEDWATETGLVNDVDVWFRNPHFGVKEEYGQVAGVDTLMFLVDFTSPEGEVLATQGYSVGSGWIASEDGMSISHPTRKNVVGSSMYGKLIQRVVKELGVDMSKYGKPTEAKSWDGRGFHIMQEEHTTVSGEVRTAPMPVAVLEGEAPGAAPAAKAAPASALEKKLTTMATSMNLPTFQKAALKMKEVTDNEDLLASILDDSSKGFWGSNQAS